jgi:hypothetical protein
VLIAQHSSPPPTEWATIVIGSNGVNEIKEHVDNVSIPKRRLPVT